MTHKPNILVIEPACFEFFNSLQWKSAAFLELVKSKFNFLYFDNYNRDSDRAEVVNKLNAIRLKAGDLTDEDSTMSYDETNAKICAYMEQYRPAHVVILNGNCSIYYNRDKEIYEDLFATVKQHHDEPMCNHVSMYFRNVANYFCTYMIMEWCAKHAPDTVFHNLWEDPLQSKYDYVPGIKLRQYYFHQLPGMQYAQVLGNKAYAKSNRSYREPAEDIKSVVKHAFEFSPSQEYWYAFCQHEQHLGIASNKLPKSYDFVFAMTDSWSQVTYRRNLILDMEHLANPDARPDKFFFHYNSKNKSVDWKYNDSNIPYEKYMELIKRAKFTLVIPSYDENCFSLRRFFESLTNDCIPLILEDCNWRWGLNNGEEICKFVEDNLLIKRSEVGQLDKIVAEKAKHYDEMLHALTNTRWWKTYNNKAFYMKHLKSMFDMD